MASGHSIGIAVSSDPLGIGLLDRDGPTNHHRSHSSGPTAHRLSTAWLRKKSDMTLVLKIRFWALRGLLANLQHVLLGTKLAILFPAVPLAILAQVFGFGKAWVFALSLIGLTTLAERISFLTEQISFFTDPTVGGLLNATCGNATQLIIAIFALYEGKIAVVKYSLIGSVLSSLLLVLGTSLFCGGLANMPREKLYDRKQADVISSSLLLLGVLCHLLTLFFRYAVNTGEAVVAVSALEPSRLCSVITLIAYLAYLYFQLKTHRQFFEVQEKIEDLDDDVVDEEPVIGFVSGLVWLVGMTIVIAILSKYIVGTIEAASESWGISVSFISVILLPIVGDSAEHAGVVISAFKNKLDITLGVSLGSATLISMFVVPFTVLVAWIMGIHMDLDFRLVQTCSLFMAVLSTAFIIKDGTSHYLKGLFCCCFALSLLHVTLFSELLQMVLGWLLLHHQLFRLHK